MYHVSLKMFDRRKVEIVLVNGRERNREIDGGVRGFGKSCFDYNVMSQTLTLISCLGGKEKETRKESSKVRWYRVEKMSPFLSIFLLFSCGMMFARCGEI